jgi:Resolvase, N terminal domain
MLPRRGRHRRTPLPHTGPSPHDAPDSPSLVAHAPSVKGKLSVGGRIYDPADPMGKMFFNILATFAEFEVDLLRLRTREGMPSLAPRAGCAANNPR